LFQFAPLKWLKEHPPVKGRSRQIFLLTDGEISDVTSVINLCRSMSSSTRIFSFGLGMSPSRALVKGLARATNGRFVFIPPNTKVDVYVQEQLHRALQPSITNIQVKWNFNGTTVRTAPTQPPPVYSDDRFIIYGLMDNITALPSNTNHSVEFYSEENRYRLGAGNFNQMSNIGNSGTIARLAAKALILELQNAKTTTADCLQSCSQEEIDLNENMEKIRKKNIIELSLNYSILSPFTAFIGVEKRINGSNIDMALREVPIQISADDQHLMLGKTFYKYMMTSNSEQCHMISRLTILVFFFITLHNSLF
jgi:hypothetical protein